MNSTCSLNDEQQQLIARLCAASLGISPQKFRQKWDISYQQMADICHCTPGTVQRWFERGRNYRRPSQYSCFKLAIADWLLENYQDIPQELLARILS
ncbi:helix-turn-helix transcriptional regulator [Limnoraphis robusta Tam1]|uniref:helix-turn-helix domain-containing protein n=1 Tax=Limnoraphis robusta TaxID=1118279 RepID=UPI002B2081D2|nr:helix-turn-helix transcriptional regulator [Limnoraphis robusta]MEA5499198.1 helix-turn-helix transcriptional regulator [Limnoraphis robusta BA-68 BA1]MEA5540681.1 helix-turn-helix transcriptional regulator [Limnoraphis robusta Tam1]